MGFGRKQPAAPDVIEPVAEPVQPAEDFAPRTLADIPRIVDLIGYTSLRPDAPARFKLGGEGAVCYYGPSACVPLAGTELSDWMDALLAQVQSTIPPDAEDFRLTFDGVSFRACRDRSGAYGEQIMLRRLPDLPPTLADLRMEIPAVRTLLEGAWLNGGGLVLLCGLTGQGKTTLASATIRTRLERFAGRCVTVEDVIEVPLEGKWNSGTCRQIRVEYGAPGTRADTDGFVGGVRRAYRMLPAANPAILYIGEVRDVETAAEVIKAAANGMLVVTTIHAGNVASALVRLFALGQTAFGSAAADSLATGLRVIVHNSLVLNPGIAGWGRGHFRGSAIVSSGPSSELANLIRAQRLIGIPAVQEFQSGHLARASASPMTCESLLRALSRADK